MGTQITVQSRISSLVIGFVITRPFLDTVLYILWEIPGWAVTRRRGFVNYYLRVPGLYGSFPAAQASKENSQETANKTSYPRNDPYFVWGKMSCVTKTTVLRL